ncbi:MAG: hypothetical protein ACI4XB_09285, partial [Ruminococcus sp.]
MQNFNQKVQLFLKKHRKQKRHAAIAVLLSFMVAFSVCGSLIMPAVSMTGSTEETMPAFELVEDVEPLVGGDSSTTTRLKNRSTGSSKPANNSGWFDSPTTAIPEGGVDFTNSITSASITIGDQTAAVPGNNSTITVDAGNADSINASFVVTYTISKDGSGTNAVTVDNPCIYYQLPDGVDTAGFSGEDRTVNDPNYDGGYAGYYSISSDGLVVIQFTEAYIKNKIEITDSFTGTVTFDGTINRDNTADGDQTITVGGVTVKVTFNDRSFVVDKTSSVTNPENATDKPTVTWTITVKNEYGKDLGGYKVTDERFPDGGNGVTVSPSDSGSWSDKEFVFNENVKNTSVTFTFTEEVNNYIGAALTETNTATLTNNTETFSDSASASLAATYIGKDGKPDYETGSMNNQINWTVTVTNPYGCTLNGYQVRDDAFVNATNIVVTNASTGESVPFTHTSGSNTITFGNGENNADVGAVKITYTALRNTESGSNVTSNTATLVYLDNSTTSTTKDVTYTNPYTLNDKTGSYSYDTGKITWTVGAECSGGVTLGDYEFIDEAFKYISLSDIDITRLYHASYDGDCTVISRDETQIVIGKKEDVWDGNQTVTNTYIYAIITLNQTDGILTVSDGTDGGIKKLSFTYTTQRTSAGTDGTEVTTTDGKTYVTNSISDNQGHSNTSNSVEVTDRDSITKSLTGDSSGGNSKDVYNSDTGTIETLNWQVEVVQDTGFSATDKVLVDVMSATNGGSHYINSAQQSSVKVYAKKQQYANYDTPLNSDLYNIIFYNIIYNENGTVASKTEVTSGDANSFEITFAEGVDNEGYKYVKVTYQTTADYTNVPDASGSTNQTATFSNTASFGGASTSSPSYNITKKDENNIEKTNISIKKEWNDTSNTTGRPASVWIRLYRKLGEEGTWKAIYKDPTAENAGWEEVNPDENSPTDYAYELNSSNGWYISWGDLPKDTVEHDVNYYYKAEELSVPDGYRVTYQNETGVTAGEFKITNTLSPNYEKVALNVDRTILSADAADQSNYSSISKNVSLNDLKTLVIDGTEYYIFRWRINMTMGNTYVLTDTLPKDSIIISADNYKPRLQKQYWGYELDSSKYTVNDGVVTFQIDENDVIFLDYYTGIPVDTLKSSVNAADPSGYVVNNSVVTSEGEPKNADFIITSSGSSADLLNKTVNTPYNTTSDGKIKAEGGRVQYTINVNPEGKTLSNTGEYDITDAFTVSGCGSLTGTSALDALDAKLFSVTVKDTAANRILSSSEYQYTVEYKYETISNSTSKEKYVFTAAESYNDNTFKYITSQPWEAGANFPEGDRVTITLNGLANQRIEQDFKIYFKGQFNQDGGDVGSIDLAPVVFDSNGK